VTRSRWSFARPLRSRWSAILAVGLTALVVIPILVIAFDGFGRTWYPAGDWAITELRVLDTGTSHTPLVGPYSRFGWNHPGPLLFWTYAVPYRLTGENSSSLLLAAGLINAASLAGMLAFAWRRGRLALVAITAVALALLLSATDVALLRDPWNPWVTVLPFGLLIMTVWSAVEGDRVALVVSVVVGSLLAQSHVGFVPLVGVLIAWGGGWFWRRTRDRRTLVWSAGVLGLCWLPVAIDMVFGGQNLAQIVEQFSRGSDPAGLRAGFEMAARQLGHTAPWMGGDEPINAFGGALLGRPGGVLVLPVLIFVAAMVLAAIRHAGDAVRFQATVGVAVLVGVFTVSRIDGGTFDYLVRWWWPLAALWWVATAWSVWSVLVGAWPVARRVVGIPLLLVGIIVAVNLMGDVTSDRHEARLPVDDWYPALDASVEPTVAGAPRGAPVLVRSAGPLSGWLQDAMTVQLAKGGVDVRVLDERINEQKFGRRRLTDGDEVAATVWIVTGPAVDVASEQSGWQLLAHYDPLTLDERRTADELDARLIERLRSGGRDAEADAIEQGLPVAYVEGVDGLTEDDFRQRDELRESGVRVAVFLAPDSSTPAPFADATK
jgi:hypothetical protein